MCFTRWTATWIPAGLKVPRSQMTNSIHSGPILTSSKQQDRFNISSKWLYCQHAEPLPCYKLMKCNCLFAQKEKRQRIKNIGMFPLSSSRWSGTAGCIIPHKYGHSCVFDYLKENKRWILGKFLNGCTPQCKHFLLELTPTHNGNYNVQWTQFSEL